MICSMRHHKVIRGSVNLTSQAPVLSRSIVDKPKIGSKIGLWMCFWLVLYIWAHGTSGASN